MKMENLSSKLIKTEFNSTKWHPREKHRWKRKPHPVVRNCASCKLRYTHMCHLSCCISHVSSEVTKVALKFMQTFDLELDRAKIFVRFMIFSVFSVMGCLIFCTHIKITCIILYLPPMNGTSFFYYFPDLFVLCGCVFFLLFFLHSEPCCIIKRSHADESSCAFVLHGWSLLLLFSQHTFLSGEGVLKGCLLFSTT